MRIVVPSTPHVPPIDYAVSYAFSLRIIVVGYTGPLIRLRRDSDDAELDFSAVPETGVLDVGAITAWLAGADGFVTTWYDQSGNNRDVVQTTDALQPKYVDWHNGNPAILWDGSDDFLQRITTPDLVQPFEIANVWQTTAQGTDTFYESADATKRIQLVVRIATPGQVLAFAGGAGFQNSSDITDADTHYIFTQFDDASSLYRLDGVQVASGVAGANNAKGLTLGSRHDGASNFYDGHQYEVIISAGGLLSGAQRSALEADQAAFYGVP